jgi:hypothetical protein
MFDVKNKTKFGICQRLISRRSVWYEENRISQSTISLSCKRIGMFQEFQVHKNVSAAKSKTNDVRYNIFVWKTRVGVDGNLQRISFNSFRLPCGLRGERNGLMTGN